MAEEQFMGQGPFGTRYFLNAALAGGTYIDLDDLNENDFIFYDLGLCCSVTHGGVVPVDVVKTRIQLDPVIVFSNSIIIIFSNSIIVIFSSNVNDFR